MSPHDVRHTVARGSTGTAAVTAAERPTTPGPDAVADRVPEEYREAYLEGFARARAVREDTAA